MTRRTSVKSLVGLAHLGEATDLLQRIRAEDRDAGLWEAADLQWWWREDGWDDPEGQLYFFDAHGRSVAGLLIHDDLERLDCDVSWLPSAREVVEAEVWPTVLGRILARSRAVARPATLFAREDDVAWTRHLLRHGFEATEPVLVQDELVLDARPAPAPLATDLRLESAGERRAGLPHPLAKRNGEHVETRLRQASLYRPDLDLAIRAGDEVAAYAVFWLDPLHGIGLVEPVRVEEAWQGRGLGRALLEAGLARLFDLGARLVRVSHREGNVPAERLYRRVGFAPTFRRVTYRLAAPRLSRAGAGPARPSASP